MPLKDYIETIAVFTLRDYLEECGDTQANRNLLSRAVKAGRVRRIKHGLYASNTGRFRDILPNRYAVVAVSVPDATYCYDSAFELIVGQQNLVERTVFYTRDRISSFEYLGHEYKPFPMPKNPIRTQGYRQADGTVENGTTLEQTIIDSVARPSRCLGVENVLRTISVVNTINARELAAILKESSISVAARIGWILEQKQEKWPVSEELLLNLQKRIGKGPYYFSTSHRRTADSFDRNWKLYFPEPVETIKAWING